MDCFDVEKMIEVLLVLLLMKPAETAGPVRFVNFTNPDYCAPKGSSVEFKCSYIYPDKETVTKTAWRKGHLKDGKWVRIELSDLPSYHNRSEYLGDHQHNCGLALHNLEDNDTGYYYFWFDTNMYGRPSKDSVHLSVIGDKLSASVQPQRVTAGNNVTLQCQTGCQHPNIVWFKDGHPWAKPNFQAQAEDAGKYWCALEGYESMRSDPMALDVWYSPMNVSVEVSHVGALMPGSSVNLTCDSVARPAADLYTWYRSNSSSSSPLQVSSGQVLSLSALNVNHNGLYFCRAKNRVGESSSTAVLVEVEEASSEFNHFILARIGVKLVIVLLLTPVIIWAWRRRRCSAANKHAENNDYEDI
ncbi:B-cell receptor CD22-like [Cololabis saira]|uniref:B-cell receptor CD22-like n=1 Tax=Cololabis saira TaxID=129043 RepID=UPI002AD22721|nr:B-cell receptor CD22-like [Cololabis saira]